MTSSNSLVGITRSVRFDDTKLPTLYYGSEATIREMYEKSINYIKRIITNTAIISKFREDTKTYYDTEKQMKKERCSAEEKLKLIDNYASVIKKYSQIITIKQTKIEKICQECDKKIKATALICECGYIVDTVYDTSSAERNQTNPLINKPVTEDRSNFEDHFNQIQGVEPVTKLLRRELDEFYNQLDRYFKSVNLPSREVYQSIDNEEEKREMINKQQVIAFMKQFNRSKLYSHVSLVMKEYFNWKLINLESYRELIMRDYDETQQYYLTCPFRGKSSINAEARLYLHLASRGIDVQKYDFKISTDIDILTKYQKIWDWISVKMCEKHPKWKKALIV